MPWRRPAHDRELPSRGDRRYAAGMRLSLVALCSAALFVASNVSAATKELKVDAFADGGEVRAQGQYVTGERFAIELSADPADYPIRITTIRALFIPTFVGGDGQVAPFHLTIYAGTGTETPGAVLWDQGDDFQVEASSSSYNEFVLPTPIDLASGSVRIAFSPTLDQSDSGVTIGQDTGPIQGTRNFIFAGGAWNRAAALGLTGNFIIRATAETNFGASNPAPVVDGVSPAEVSEDEAATLTITGSNFQAGATVRVGTTPLTDVQVSGTSAITARLGANLLSPGSFAVTVTNPDGKSGTRNAAVTIVAGGGGGGGAGGGGGGSVRLDSIVPGVAPAGRAVEFVLFGEGFAAGATVTLGGGAASGVQALDGRTLRGVTPADLPAGAHDVTVTVPGDGSATLRGGWLVVEGGGGEGAVLDVDRVVPEIVERGEGHELVVLGAGFTDGVQITVGGLPLGTPTRLGAGAVHGFTPDLAPGLYDVVATAPDGTSSSRAEALEVVGSLGGDAAGEGGSGSAQDAGGCGCAMGQGGSAGLLGLLAFAGLLRRRARGGGRRAER